MESRLSGDIAPRCDSGCSLENSGCNVLVGLGNDCSFEFGCDVLIDLGEGCSFGSLSNRGNDCSSPEFDGDALIDLGNDCSSPESDKIALGDLGNDCSPLNLMVIR